MIRLAATICLVPEMKTGPFLYSGDLAESCRRAAQAGFDGVELMVPDAESVDAAALHRLLAEHGLTLSGIGTGAGFVVRRLHLCSPDPQIRRQAIEFAAKIVDLAGELGAFAIIGSLKGSIQPGVDRAATMGWLRDSLAQLARQASRYDVPLILEPLNRYESNCLNRLDEGVELIKALPVRNIRLLADLFHMNIEEPSIAGSLRAAAGYVGHIHFADSNRRPAGCGHVEFAAIGRVLHDIGYQGYLAAEALAWPDSDRAAVQTVRTFKEHIVPGTKSESRDPPDREGI